VLASSIIRAMMVLMMEAASTSTRLHGATAEDSHLHTRRRENLKSYLDVLVVFCGCETWSLVLREEHRLRVSEQDAEENIWT
jgi:hypothetical protein